MLFKLRKLNDPLNAKRNRCAVPQIRTGECFNLSEVYERDGGMLLKN